MTDLGTQLQAAVREAAADRQPLYIEGGNSKRDWLGRACSARPLPVAGHRGIIDYQPQELVISARAGTPVSELVDAVSAQGQVLPFEPAILNGAATVGGTVACNLSGPGRPWWGSVRDAVLGLGLINGNGEQLNFGGRVMKNVAGYDVSRLQAGALGCLGLVTEVHLKVLPQPEQEQTLAYTLDAGAALATMRRRAAGPGPLTGACWLDGVLYLRLSGAARAVAQAAADWGGDSVVTPPWAALREFRLPQLAQDSPLWRVSCGPTAALDGREQLIDWAGAQRFISGTERPATPAGGHVTLFRGGDRAGEVREPLAAPQQLLQQRLKQSLDPAGIFNPGRLYHWM